VVIAASLVAALFGTYSYPVLRKYPTSDGSGTRTRSRRDQQNGR